jgi:hypothetical protein
MHAVSNTQRSLPMNDFRIFAQFHLSLLCWRRSIIKLMQNVKLASIYTSTVIYNKQKWDSFIGPPILILILIVEFISALPMSAVISIAFLKVKRWKRFGGVNSYRFYGIRSSVGRIPQVLSMADYEQEYLIVSAILKRRAKSCRCSFCHPFK